MIPVFKPQISKDDLKAVNDVLISGWIGNGPKTEEFEKRFLSYISGKYGVALNSASAALHLALLCLNLKMDDEVITPSLTFVATNHPILLAGAKPVFADVCYDTLCIDPLDIEKKISKKTKAVIAVHYGGNPAKLDEIIKICKKNKLSLIEDCSHAAGSYYKGKHVGTFGDFSCFSFAAIKNITTGDGGMLVAKNKNAIDRARAFSWSGISKSTWQRAKKGKLKWEYNIVSTGWKYQMNDIAAALGLSQLEKLNSNNLKRKKITDRYDNVLGKIKWLEIPKIESHVQISNHNYVIKVPQKIRDRLSKYLGEKGISTSVHYVPSHHYPMYSSFSSSLPVTETVWKKILLLPIFPSLSEKDQNYIIDSIKNFKP